MVGGDAVLVGMTKRRAAEERMGWDGMEHVEHRGAGGRGKPMPRGMG